MLIKLFKIASLIVKTKKVYKNYSKRKIKYVFSHALTLSVLITASFPA